jgi:predicted transcriptional regulator
MNMLLSVRPEFADRLFDGSKTMELRRIRPRVEAIDWVVIYVSSPTMAITGAFRVAKVIEGHPKSLWPKVREGAAVSWSEFEAYYSGAPRGYAMVLADLRRFSQPVGLQELRRQWADFRPPQSFRYLDREKTLLTTGRQLT